MEASSAIKSVRPSLFSGWALERATFLDLQGNRGLVADIAVAPLLKRQAIFTALSTIDTATPITFCRGEPHSTMGDTFRTRQARDLIAAAFGMEEVPAGYLRALTRVGSRPLDEPTLYRRLFEIFTTEADSQKAHALRYCGQIHSETLRAVDALDSVLVCPEVLKSIRGVAQAQKANSIIQFLRDVCSTATDDVLAAGVRQASGHGGLERFAQEFVKRADRFPEPPLPTHPDFIPLTSAAEFVSLGRSMRNCAASKIPQALLGLASYYQTEIKIGNEAVPVVVELTPLSNGAWALQSLNMPKNQHMPRGIMASLVKRLKGHGVVIEANPRLHAQASDLARLFGVFPLGEFQLLTQEEEPDAGSPDMDDMLDMMVEEFEQAMRVT